MRPLATGWPARALLVCLVAAIASASSLHVESISSPSGEPFALRRLAKRQAPSSQLGGSRELQHSSQQQQSKQQQQHSATPNSSGSDGQSGAGSQDGAGGQEGDSEKPPDEILSSIKCDFGTADAPDLCKFKIIAPDETSPLARGLPGWSLGSGRLALFQGGPLIDASPSNDTSGGYIYYETSHAAHVAQNGTGSEPASSKFGAPAEPLRMPGPAQPAPPHAATHLRQPVPYSLQEPYARAAQLGSRPSGSGTVVKLRREHEHAMQVAGEPAMFQQLSSGRLLVASPAGQPAGPAFVSANLSAPVPSGMCLSFRYAIQGLSADELRVQVNDLKRDRSRLLWASSESSASNWTRAEVLYSVTNLHSLTFSAAPPTSMLGPALSQQRKFRGYIAVDEIEVSRHDPAGAGDAAPCRGHCNFDGDLCGWTNAENGAEDDFDWSFGRGSENLFTGPPRDFVSSTNNDLTGSYLFTDSGYPRRPGDRALLMSPQFQPTAVNEAMCMRFAVHMFGSGIGSLSIKLRYSDAEVAATVAAAGAASSAAGGAPGQTGSSAPSASGGSPDSSRRNQDVVIWEMSGDAGNAWHQAQTSVSSARSPFQVLIEGTVGENHLGNMAIDEISFAPGPCPTSPPVASKNYGDCTFEQSMCYWRNPDAEIHLDDLDWVRSADEQSIHGPSHDHTLKKRSGSYLKLENTFREPKSGSRAFLLSPIFPPKGPAGVQCLSFYYYMFMRSISSQGPNLGTIRVYLASNNELVPIWRLTNPISSPVWKQARASLASGLLDGQPVAPGKLFQIAFEGIWGDANGGAIAIDDVTVFDGACEIMPAEAKSVPGECTFDVDMCSWTNKSASSLAAMADSAYTDQSRSPFLQSVGQQVPSMSPGSHRYGMPLARQQQAATVGWQLATIDSRPVNLQDHTYKAPIGYAYVDVLESGVPPMNFTLQGSETAVQQGAQQVSQCLSFWFAAYGRQDANQLGVYLTQASAPPPSPEEGSTDSGASAALMVQAMRGGAGGATRGSQTNMAGPQASASSSPQSNSGGSSSSDSETESANRWRDYDGKLIWSISTRNLGDTQRRKWQYGQVNVKADSNYIVRFIATTNDGGFALDDISYYEGACETRPAMARVMTEEELPPSSNPATPAGTPNTASANQQNPKAQ